MHDELLLFLHEDAPVLVDDDDHLACCGLCAHRPFVVLGTYRKICYLATLHFQRWALALFFALSRRYDWPKWSRDGAAGIILPFGHCKINSSTKNSVQEKLRTFALSEGSGAGRFYCYICHFLESAGGLESSLNSKLTT